MLNGLVRQRIHAPRVHGRHSELDANGQRGVDNGHQHNRGINAEAHEAQKANNNDSRAQQHGAAHTVTIEQAASKQAGERANNRTGQKRHAAYGGAMTQHTLNVQRHDGFHANKGSLEQRDDDNNRAILRRFQNVNAQHRLI